VLPPVDAALFEEFRQKFEANSAASPLPYAPVPKVPPQGASLLHDLPDDRTCATSGIPSSVCRLVDLVKEPEAAVEADAGDGGPMDGQPDDEGEEAAGDEEAAADYADGTEADEAGIA